LTILSLLEILNFHFPSVKNILLAGNSALVPLLNFLLQNDFYHVSILIIKIRLPILSEGFMQRRLMRPNLSEVKEK